jgi:hypothetical protein
MYKQTKLDLGQTEPSSVIRLSDNACIPFDIQNVDYQAYLKFIEDGGVPLPAEVTV